MATENRKSNSGTMGNDSTERKGKGIGTNPSPESSAEGRTGGTGAGNNNSGTGTAEKEKISGLASVEQSETVPVPKKARKKRTVKKKTSKNDEAFNAEQITALLMTVSAICSTTERGRIFALSEIECKQLAEPLSKIIATNDSMKSIAEHSDSVALAMTCFMIFAPKIFIWLQYEKAHRKPKGVEIKTIKGGKENAKKANGNSGADNAGVTIDSANNGENVSAVLPSIM